MRGISGPYPFILITLMIDAIGIGIVFPIMPDLMIRVGAGGTAQGSIWAGILMSAYSWSTIPFCACCWFDLGRVGTQGAQ